MSTIDGAPTGAEEAAMSGGWRQSPGPSFGQQHSAPTSRLTVVIMALIVAGLVYYGMKRSGKI